MNPVAPAAPVVPKSWENEYNIYVEKISGEGVINVTGLFSIKLEGTEADPADGTLKKVAKVFFMTLASIVLYPLALACNAFKWVRNVGDGFLENVCGKPAADDAHVDGRVPEVDDNADEVNDNTHEVDHLDDQDSDMCQENAKRYHTLSPAHGDDPEIESID